MKTSVVAATELLWNSEKLCGWCDRDWCPFHSQKLLIEIIIWWCYTASNWSWDSHHFTFQCYRHLQAHSGNGWFSAIPSPIGGFWHCWKTTLSHEPSIVSRLYIYILYVYIPMYLCIYIHTYIYIQPMQRGRLAKYWGLPNHNFQPLWWLTMAATERGSSKPETMDSPIKSIDLTHHWPSPAPPAKPTSKAGPAARPDTAAEATDMAAQ